MNQKTIKLKILLLVLFLLAFQIVILSNIPTFMHPIIDDKQEDLNPITSSSGWGPEITKAIGLVNEIGFDVFVGDANNDGYNDIATANHYTYDISLLLWNPGLGDWDPYIKKSVGDWTRSVTIGDTNNDGENDLVVGWWESLQGRISIFLWNASILDWNDPIKKNITSEPGNVHVGDIDNDGDNDILVGGYGGARFSCFFWNESLSNWDAEVSKILTADVSDVFLGDANNDGFNDVVATLSNYNVSISIWNESLSDWNSDIEKSVGDAPQNIFIEDANNDGYNDIAVANGNSNDISVLIWNNSISDWNGEIRKSTGDQPFGISVNDANNDGYNDIVVVNRNDNNISIYTWNSILNDWNPEMKIAISVNPIEVFVEDVNNDGSNDIVSAGFSTLISILLSYIDTPILYAISPGVDDDGTVELNWSDVIGITHYYVYRDTQEIYSIDGLDPIASVFDSNYTEFLPFNGNYYYVVVASDGYKNSSMSNYESVRVDVPIDAPQLEHVAPNLDTDGIIHLNWSDVDRAPGYFVCRDTSYINSFDPLLIINGVFESNFTDTIETNGIYYYVVMAAENDAPISNCEEVTVGIPLEPPNLGWINYYNNGTLEITWTEVENATFYYVYRDNSTITSIEHLDPIATVPSLGNNSLSYSNALHKTGNYYYAVVASDGFGYSSISNSIGMYVEIVEPIVPGISGYNLYFIMVITSLLAMIIGKKKFKKKQ